MSYDNWKTHNPAEDWPDEEEALEVEVEVEEETLGASRGWCPSCRMHFDGRDVTLEPYCSARCRIEGEQRDTP